MSELFKPLVLRSVTMRNRIFVAPMCMYSSVDGMPTDWHLVHLGSRAVGGAGMVIVEATAVCPEGRISPGDSGLWSEKHATAFVPITRFMREHGAVPAIQLAHAGRKASTNPPWCEQEVLSPQQGGWPVVGPSAIAFDQDHPVPRELSVPEIAQLVERFQASARWSYEAGFEVIELHMAHGYLLHEFLSPLSNQRTDSYGGSLENRMRFPLLIAEAVRKVWPAKLPLLVRISATDWAQGGWDLEQSIVFCTRLKALGVDLIDCSSGALVPRVKMPIGPGYQVQFAQAIRQSAGIATGAVGMVTKPEQAETIIATGQADAVLLAREMLRDPYWPQHAAKALGVPSDWPKQYARAVK